MANLFLKYQHVKISKLTLNFFHKLFLRHCHAMTQSQTFPLSQILICINANCGINIML